MNKSMGLLIPGIVGPVVAISLIFADTSTSAWFTWTGNALSDLGVHPHSYLFNYALIFEAIMNVFFSIGLIGVYNSGRGISGTLMASGISLGLVGIFVETYHLYHLTFALIYIILFPIAIILFSHRVSSRHRGLAATGYVFAAVSLVTIVLGVAIDFNAIPGVTLGLAIPEMVEACLLSAWSVITAATGIRIAGSGNVQGTGSVTSGR